MMRSIAASWLLAVPSAARAADRGISVTGGKTDQTNVVVKAPVPKDATATGNVLNLSSGGTVPVQVAAAAQTDDPAVTRYLVFVLPKLKAGETVTGKLGTVNNVAAPPAFKFVEKTGEPTDLLFVGAGTSRKVLQYFNLPRDEKDHYYTFKPFHNVYDPTGAVMLTNTSSKSAKDGQFPHHRGLFFGFNKVTHGDNQAADIWHGTNNVFSQHDKMLATEAGEVLGRHRSAISWHGKDAKTFANEERELTVYATQGGTLIDWSTVVTTGLDKVRLDGDPQHAGFHFRANMEVSKTNKETYYVRPDGRGKPGETRNWDAKGKDPKTVNLPWDACSFVVGGKRYTVLRISHPDNPKEARGSERDYGRFGDYFEYDLTPEKPLKLRYRVWVQPGEMTVPQCEAIARAFVSPPKAE
ncbi:MAG: DUF6807 family protein [Gemmata sp.]